MVNKPNYKIIVNSDDVTNSIKPYMMSLSITDNMKDNADTLEMTLSAKFKRPNYADEIKVYLGWGNSSQFLGLFFVQSTTINNNKQLSIQATGINYSANLKERRNKHYDAKLNDVVQQIAARHNLKVKTNMNVIQRFEQRNESDIAFLNRLAKEHNAIFNIKNNTLYMMQQAKNVPKIKINIDQCLSSEITHTNTTMYKSCKAIYHNTKLNMTVTVQYGDGEPVLNKQGKWLNDQQALVDAKNALQRANQGTAKGTLTIKGIAVFAGSGLSLDNQNYTINKVTHNMSNQGWSTDISFQQADVK